MALEVSNGSILARAVDDISVSELEQDVVMLDGGGGGAFSGGGGSTSSGSTGGHRRTDTTTTTTSSSTRRGSTTTTSGVPRGAVSTDGTTSSGRGGVGRTVTPTTSTDDKVGRIVGSITETSTNTDIDRENLTVDAYKNSPNTLLDYSKDLLGVYLVSEINLYKWSNDGASGSSSVPVQYLTYSTTLPENSTYLLSADQTLFIDLLCDQFSIDNSQSTKLIQNFFTKNIPQTISPIFINYLSKEEINDKIKGSLELDSANKRFKVTFTKDKTEVDSDNQSNTGKTYNYRVEFYVIFKRDYLFEGRQASLNKYIQLETNNYQIKFTPNNLPSDYGLNVTYSDIYSFLWFSVESYLKVHDIFANITYVEGDSESEISLRLYSNNDTPDREASPSGDIIPIALNNTNNNAEYSSLANTKDYSIKDSNGYPLLLLNADDLNIINSDYYTKQEEVEVKYIFSFKSYLSKKYLATILNRIYNEETDNLEKKIKLIEIFIEFDNTNVLAGGEALSDACAIQAYSNTHCKVDYIDKTIKLYSTYKPEEHKSGLVARYILNAGETSFHGSVSVFYGNQLVYPENKKINNKDLITISNSKGNTSSDSEVYKENTIYYQILTKDDYLDVYLKVNKKEGSNNSFDLNRFVTITLSDNIATYNPDDDIEYTNITGKIAQDKIIVHNIDQNIPQISYGDSLVLIDSSTNNKTKHYTYYTLLENNKDSYSYYGVRAVAYYTGLQNGGNNYTSPKYLDNLFFSTGINYLSYNVPAKIVKLNVTEEEQNIYSFRNGEQLIYLNKPEQLGTKEYGSGEILYNVTTNNNVKLLSELLPHYRFSYEYIVKGRVPDDENKDYNFTFYPTYAHKGWVPASYVYYNDFSDIKSKYQLHIPYTIINKDVNYKTYTKISNMSANYPIYENLDSQIENNLYELSYLEYSDNLYNNCLDKNLYEKVEEYVKIQAGSISLQTFKSAVLYSETVADQDSARYYKYSSLSKQYTPYTYDEVEDLEYIPLNIYVKYIYYLSRSVTNIPNTDRSKYYIRDITGSRRSNLEESTAQINKITNYQLWNNALQSEGTYYQVRNDSDILPWTGFRKDGSQDYYGYVFVSLDKIDANNVDASSYDPLNYVISQDYSQVWGANNSPYLTEKEFNDYRFKKIDLYTEAIKDQSFGFIPIPDDYTIFNLDVSGDTIYAWDETYEAIIDIDVIRDKYYHIKDNAGINDWDPDWETSDRANRDNIERNSANPYWLKNFDWDDSPQKRYIKYIVSLDGNYEKVNYLDKNIWEKYLNTGSDKRKFYILNKNSQINLKKLDKNNPAANEWFTYLLKYNVKDKIYQRTLSKLGANELSDDYTRYGGQLYAKIHYSNDSYEYRKLDSYTGIIEGMTVYQYHQNYNTSYDIHTCIHKDYYKYNESYGQSSIYIYTGNNNNVSFDGSEWDINWNAITGENIQAVNPTTVTSDLYPYVRFSTTDIQFYEMGINEFSYNSDVHYTQLDDLNGFYKSHTAYADYANNGGSCYTLDVFYKSNFFYPDFSVASDIQIDKDGSYFTNILVFDSYVGKISKKLYLNHHIRNTKRYTYDYPIESYIDVDPKRYNDLEGIPAYEYSKYYVNMEGEYMQLNEKGNSPAYYASNKYALFTKYVETGTNIYNNLDGTNQLGEGKYGDPVVIQKNDNFYGLIFETDPYVTTYTDYILFSSEEVPEAINGETGNDDALLQDSEFYKRYISPHYITPYNTISITRFDYGDNTTNREGADKDPFKEAAMVSANNELYYNNYLESDTKTLFAGNLGFIPANFKYEIVELSKFTFRNYNSSRNLLQARGIVSAPITIDRPFALTNNDNIEFTGTYTWIPPKYKNIINEQGINTIAIAQDGYWEKDYKKTKDPFIVSAYNYYLKDEVSAINISYSFVPYSYILSAKIEHPAISYEYLSNEIVEEYRFSYIINGFEYDYDNNLPISYENGSYYGTIDLLDIEGSYVEAKVALYKRNITLTKTKVKKVNYQKEHNSYEYFAYIQATPLTNEKIPVLYNTELIPATSTNIKYWDERTQSYAIKTVIDSYSYYSYKYKYETVPFQVASYIFTDDLRISNFPVLGAYVDHVADVIDTRIGAQSNSIVAMTYDLSYIFKDILRQNKVIADKHDEIFKSYTDVLNKEVKDFNITTNTSLSYLANDLSNKLTIFTDTEEKAINNLEVNTVNELIEHRNIVKDGFSNTVSTLDRDLTGFKDKMHEDLMGGDASKEIVTSIEKTTYTPIKNRRSNIVSGYTYKTESTSETIEAGGESIGEILANTLGTISEYTSTDLHNDGSYTITTRKGFIGIGEILANLSINKKLPDYKEFMVDLVPKLFSAVDFEGDYDVKYDIFGNIKSRTKRNPNDIAKKCVMRADILWNELKKKGIVS